MRKFLFALLAAPLLFGACSDDNDDSTPTLSFAKPVLALSTGSVTLDLQVSGVDLSSLASPVTVPVAFSGTAVKGSEYSVSAEQFILGGNNQSLSITVTALDNYDEAKEIVATLGSVADFIPGKNATAKISLGVKGKIMYSFSVKSMTMGETGSVQLDLYTATGAKYTAEQDIVIPIEIAEGSTAVENTNFTFEGAKQLVVAQGKSSGAITLKAGTLETGKDKVVLKTGLENNKGFVRGQYNEITVTIFGSYFSKLEGTWKMSAEGNYDPTEFANLNGSSSEYDKPTFDADMAALPAYNAKDRLIFTEEGLTTSLESTLKNFFRENSGISKGEEIIVREGMGTKVPLQLILLDNVNRYFSATEQSEDTEAYIGINFKDGDSNKMKIYFVDYNSKSFLVDKIYYEETKPTTTYSPFISFTFERVTE
ncbi:MAG: hypothetical protein J6K02_04285 [Alistipes sp.]|jgi:hypothetical protein|uniref:hypothetical protein n=1 Tax=Alistipes TaxID=239759 RepID=UPI001B50FCDB|nr:hypothetical protein [Alistipes sp.]MBP3527879.1 hypothetical protein [Alistipes sp.]